MEPDTSHLESGLNTYIHVYVVYYIESKPSNMDTNGAELLLVRCPHFRGSKSGIYLGWEMVSCLEMCLHFKKGSVYVAMYKH